MEEVEGRRGERRDRWMDGDGGGETKSGLFVNGQARFGCSVAAQQVLPLESRGSCAFTCFPSTCLGFHGEPHPWPSTSQASNNDATQAVD